MKKERKKGSYLKIINSKQRNLIKLIINFLFLLLYFFPIFQQNRTSLLEYKYPSEEITLVTTLYQLPTNRHIFTEYFQWIENLLQINRPIIIYIQKNLSQIIKSKRPKIYENKTIWIENEFSELYFYNYKKEFEKTYIIDGLKNIHNIHLFIIWNEKLKFLEKAIKINYFKSEYFFWIDAGYFKEKDMKKFINKWPSINKCKEDPRVIMNEIRKIGKEELEKLMAFDEETHNRFKNGFNIAGNAYGGRSDYLIKFINYYYDIFNLFMKKEKFIGMDQNIYAIISNLHPEIAKIIHSGDYQFLKSYYLEK